MTRPIRISLPSKGRLAEEVLDLLTACGLQVYRPNPRQYEATIPSIPGLHVLFQRAGDIVTSLLNGSTDFGITGLDVVEEHRGEDGELLVLHEALGFGKCNLAVAVPESWGFAETAQQLRDVSVSLDRPLRVATKFPVLATRFFAERNIPITLVDAEGTLELAPAIGFADIIADLVSSGQTLKDNRLTPIQDGVILKSQAVLVANRAALNTPDVLAVARQLLELIEAHLRAENNLSIFANVRGESAQAIAEKVFSQKTIGGLNGPTVSSIIHRDGDPKWFALHIIIHRDDLFSAISELRAIGGSGVVVAPVTYIFEEEPPRYKAMLDALKG